ncbi:MAG: hypothetical protein KIT27_07045 [Legionellales bacterium]|nr:hypothetical protein [Legionellales bacterium]
MKSTKVSVGMALQVWWMHFLLASRLTAVVMFFMYVFALITMALLGKPINFYVYYEHRWIIGLFAIFIYMIPGSIWAVRSLMNRQFSHFRVLTLADE